jgi:vacuolar-type H+-ATPase subunit C/Vma6
MMRSAYNDLDYLAARVHGRRGRMAEGARLETLCRLSSVAELGASVFPGAPPLEGRALQHRLLQELLQELTELRDHLSGAAGELMAWLRVRFQLENVKVLLRGFVHGWPAQVLREHLLWLPEDLALDVESLAPAASLEQFLGAQPIELSFRSVRRTADLYEQQPSAFFPEAMLECRYLRELADRARALSPDDRDLITPLVSHELDSFHLMLAVRGRFGYGVAPEALDAFYAAGSGISHAEFRTLLRDPDAHAVARRTLGRVLDSLPPESARPERSSAVESLRFESWAWKRFRRLAAQVFRRSPLGFPVVFAYVCLRRVEVANLMTLAEGLKAGLASDLIRARLVAPVVPEAEHV